MLTYAADLSSLSQEAAKRSVFRFYNRTLSLQLLCFQGGNMFVKPAGYRTWLNKVFLKKKLS